MKKIRVLFVCIHNAARSQMAEAFMNIYGAEHFHAESGGFETSIINPLAIEVMSEIGVDISNNSIDSVFELFKEGRHYGYIVTVCDQGQQQKCPIFPGVSETIHWSIEDPSSFEGNHDEKLSKTRAVRDIIKSKVLDLIEELKLRHNL